VAFDREKMRSIRVGSRTRARTREYRDPADGHRIKATRDELGHITTEHATKDDRVDIDIRPPTVNLGIRNE
jgi:hypothetical protein